MCSLQIVFFLDKNHQVHPVSKFQTQHLLCLNGCESGEYELKFDHRQFNFTDHVVNKWLSRDKNLVASSSNFKRCKNKLWVSTGKSSYNICEMSYALIYQCVAKLGLK